MNLRWKSFEKSLRARVKYHDARYSMTFWQRVGHFFDVHSTSPAKNQRGVLSNAATIFMRGLFCVFFIAMVMGVASFDNQVLTAQPDVLMTGMALWSLISTTVQIDLIRGAAQNNEEYRSLWMLPLTPDRIFRQVMSSVLFGRACLFIEFLCVYGLVTFAHRLSYFSFAVSVLCACLQAAFSLAVILIFLRRKMNAMWLLLPLLPLWFIFTGLLPGSLDRGLRMTMLDLSIPTGWINAVFLDGWIRGEPQGWWFLAAAVAVLATLPSSLRAFRRMHHRGEFRNVAVSVMAARMGVLVARSEPIEAPPPKADSAELRRQILALDLLHPLPWNERGLLERLLARILRADEIAVAKALLVPPQDWTKRFLSFAVYLFLLWLAHAVIDFEWLQNLDSRYRWGMIVLIAAILLSWALFVVAVRAAFKLFCWSGHLSSELLLLPVHGFKLWKVDARINGLILAMILPLALLIPYSPLNLYSRTHELGGIGFLARVIVVLGSCSLNGSWISCIPRLWPLNLFLTRTVAVFSPILPIFPGLAWIVSNPASDYLLAPLFILVPLAWNHLCAFLEREAWRRAALHSGNEE